MGPPSVEQDPESTETLPAAHAGGDGTVLYETAIALGLALQEGPQGFFLVLL